MRDKKKHHFLQLAVIFGVITLLTLLYAWGSREGTMSNTGMMGASMGSMMQSMHAKNITISDLIKQQEQTEMASGGMLSHHEGGSAGIKLSHYLTTGIIIVLLPFIIAGAIFLGVVWWR
ncbi:MAG: hypothetical protein N3B21_09645 [Clostridia bacterium]|nr:hypothetical protein [Clostridia bacterium]